MTLKQNIGRIDHVAIVVKPENFEPCVSSYSAIFGIEFGSSCRFDDLAIRVAVSWDAGLEILAPLDARSSHWKRLEERGEGYCVVVFGVKDLDDAMVRAKGNGAEVLYEVNGLGQPVPWHDRFKILKEAKLADIFGTSCCLGQIEPRY